MERIGAVQACVDKIVAAQTKEIDIKFGSGTNKRD